MATTQLGMLSLSCFTDDSVNQVKIQLLGIQMVFGFTLTVYFPFLTNNKQLDDCV